jgi:hypothetical protein
MLQFFGGLERVKERTGYCHLKEEVLDCKMWRVCSGRGFGPVVRQTDRQINELIISVRRI